MICFLGLAVAIDFGALATSGGDDVSIIQKSPIVEGKDHIRTSHASNGSAKNVGDAIKELTKWITSNGGRVNEHLYGGLTQHGGSEVRGIVTDTSNILAPPLLEIPKKLWLTLDHFPSFADAALPATEQCDKTAKTNSWLQLAAAIATEARKGRESFYYPYIQSLPSMNDLQSFLPVLIKKPLKTMFSALPVVVEANKLQKFFRDYFRVCFLQWKKQPSSPITDLTSEELLLAWAWLGTRSYDDPWGSPRDVMIPFVDMLNTAESFYTNTDWVFRNLSFTVEEKEPMKQEESSSGRRELYDEYCGHCNNEEMLGHWGVYFESNPNRLNHSKVNCAGHSRGRLKVSMEATLNLSSNSDMWVSPRCHESVMSEPQGPLQCSLGRLTWEYCANAWGLSS